jgi:hypothetical protein
MEHCAGLVLGRKLGRGAMRDMSVKQYMAALERHGFEPQPFGWVKINKVREVHPANAGPRLRDRLAYLIKCKEEHTND